MFGKCVKFKKYLHGICDAGVRLLFKLWLVMHGLNEKLGIGMVVYNVCCVVRVWDCNSCVMGLSSIIIIIMKI